MSLGCVSSCSLLPLQQNNNKKNYAKLGSCNQALEFLLFCNAFHLITSYKVTATVLKPLNKQQPTGGLMLSSQTLFKHTELHFKYWRSLKFLESLMIQNMSDEIWCE